MNSEYPEMMVVFVYSPFLRSALLQSLSFWFPVKRILHYATRSPYESQSTHFLPLNVSITSSSPHRTLISLLDLISYSPVRSFFRVQKAKMRDKNFLSRTANFLSFSFDVGHVSRAYRITVLTKTLYNRLFEIFDNTS